MNSKPERHDGFLVISRKIGESVEIGTSIVIISKIKSKNCVVLAIQTEKKIPVFRTKSKDVNKP